MPEDGVEWDEGDGLLQSGHSCIGKGVAHLSGSLSKRFLGCFDMCFYAQWFLQPSQFWT